MLTLEQDKELEMVKLQKQNKEVLYLEVTSVVFTQLKNGESMMVLSLNYVNCP